MVFLCFFPPFLRNFRTINNRNELNLGYFNAFELNGLGDLGIGISAWVIMEPSEQDWGWISPLV